MFYFKVKGKKHFKCESKGEWRTELEYLMGWEEMSSPEKQTNQAWIVFLYLEQAMLACGFVKKIQELEALDARAPGGENQHFSAVGLQGLGCEWMERKPGVSPAEGQPSQVTHPGWAPFAWLHTWHDSQGIFLSNVTYVHIS